MKAAEGKRLMYKDPLAEREYTKKREKKEAGEPARRRLAEVKAVSSEGWEERREN